MRNHVAILLASLWMSCPSHAQPTARLAIVAVQDETRPAADLLTAGLSLKTNLALVERNELDKAFRERGFARSQRADLSELGDWLDADGLLLLETTGPGSAPKLAVRLVAVNSGVVLDSALFPLPLTEPAAWADVVAARLARLTPKLLVPGDRAVPISVLNLHAGVATVQAADTERAISTLLSHRLTAESNIFVLERRQLGRAGFERTLALNDKPFWTGGYLLEGLIDAGGASPDNLSISAQLLPPANGKPVTVNASGARRNLAEVVDQLAHKILLALRIDSKIITWDRAAEAERFEQECSWGLRWRMWPETYAAAESAWQLGRHTESAATARLLALLNQTAPDQDFDFDFERKIRSSNRARRYDPVRDAAWTTNQPPASDVAHALEAASSYVGLSALPECSWNTNAAWLDLGTNILVTASAVIAHQYLYGWRFTHFDSDLPALRAAVRNLASALPAQRVDDLAWRMSTYWYDSPAATAGFYRNKIESGSCDPIRLFTRSIFEPLWVAWSPADRETGAREWQNLLSGLQRSTNSQVRAQAALLKLHCARLDPDIALAQEEFLDAVLDESRARFTTHVNFSVLDAFDVVWTNRCARPLTLRRERLQAAWKSYDFARAKHYLQTAAVHDVKRAEWPYAQRFFTQDQAREMLPVVDDYIARTRSGSSMQGFRLRLAGLASKPTDPLQALLSDPVYNPERFRAAFSGREFTSEEARQLASPVRACASRHGWPQELRDLDARLQAILVQANSAPTNQPSAFAGPTLKLTRQIVPLFRNFRGESLPARIQSWLDYEGKLIAIGVHPLSGSTWPPPANGPHVIETDFATGSSRMLPQVLQVEDYLPLKFQVIRGQVFWIAGPNQLGILERRSQDQRLCSIDLPLLQAQLVALDHRLFIVSADYLAEFSISDSSVKLLASKRRKPAASQLDSWTGWNAIPQLWLNRNGDLLANLGGTNIWSLIPSQGDWREWNASNDRSDLPWKLSSTSGSPRCLAEQVWLNGTRRTLLSVDRSALPSWPVPFDFLSLPQRGRGESPWHFDGTNLWLLSPPPLATDQKPVAADGLTFKNMRLFWFHPNWEMPRVIPLQLGLEAGRNQSPMRFSITNLDAGLLVYPVNIFPGRWSEFTAWVIPWRELESWISERRLDTRNLPRTQPERRQRFDKDGDGVLNLVELQALNADTSWIDQEEQGLTRRMLFTFDSNSDNQLDLAELTRLAGMEYPGIFRAEDPAPRARPPLDPRAWDPQSLLAQFDANQDNTIADQELRRLFLHLAQPESPAGPRRFSGQIRPPVTRPTSTPGNPGQN